jgi:hypothetical protein
MVAMRPKFRFKALASATCRRPGLNAIDPRSSGTNKKARNDAGLFLSSLDADYA